MQVFELVSLIPKVEPSKAQSITSWGNQSINDSAPFSKDFHYDNWDALSREILLRRSGLIRPFCIFLFLFFSSFLYNLYSRGKYLCGNRRWEYCTLHSRRGQTKWKGKHLWILYWSSAVTRNQYWLFVVEQYILSTNEQILTNNHPLFQLYPPCSLSFDWIKWRTLDGERNW